MICEITLIDNTDFQGFEWVFFRKPLSIEYKVCFLRFPLYKIV